MTLHLIKLAVGAKTIADIRAWQTLRAKQAPPLRHRTRNFPKRAAELTDGGSIYWVIAGVLSARQRIKDIVEAKQDDGTRCTDILLHRQLVPVVGRYVKPFQGWRYLAAADAPADLTAGQATLANLPEALRRELAALALI